MALKTHGTMAVDWEQRIDFDRLRRERLAQGQGSAGQVRDGRAALFRHEQCALPDLDAHRHHGRRTRPTASRCCRRTTSPSCGISARPPSIIN